MLRDAGITARIHRVDIEPALNAALERRGFDLIVLDPRTPGITRELVEARLREQPGAIPIITLDRFDALMTALQQFMVSRRN